MDFLGGPRRLSLAFFIDVQTIIAGIAAIGLAVMLKSLQARAS